MNDWLRIAQDAADATFERARIHLHYVKAGHAVAWADDGLGTVLVVAAGGTSAEAFRALIQQCYRDDHRPTTAEVAAVIGVSDGRVRQFVQSGELVPEEPGTRGKPARFRPGDVYAMIAKERVR